MINTKVESARDLHLHRQDMYKQVDAYHQKFVDPKTGEIDLRYVQKRSCPLCGRDHPRVMFRKNGGTYVMCENCSMVYLNPVFRDEELRRYYAENNTAQASAHESENEFYCGIYKQGLISIGNFVEPDDILDIGCSGGLFLDIARKAGWQTYGIELNKAEYAIAQGRGHAVWDCPVEDLPLDAKFSVVAMWDVFEHIKDGSTLLATIRTKLKSKGLIFLQVPSVTSLAARILWDRCNMFDGIEHVNLYSPRTMKLLADQSGLEVLSMVTVIDELKVAKNYMAYQDPYFGDFAESSDLGFLTSKLVHENLLGYKIQVILRCLSSK